MAKVFSGYCDIVSVVQLGAFFDNVFVTLVTSLLRKLAKDCWIGNVNQWRIEVNIFFLRV
jgi:hypothetical protein